MHLFLFLLFEEQLSTFEQANKIIFGKFLKVKDDLDKFSINIVISIKVHALYGVFNPAKCMQLDLQTGHKKICEKFCKHFQSE